MFLYFINNTSANNLFLDSHLSIYTYTSRKNIMCIMTQDLDYFFLLWIYPKIFIRDSVQNNISNNFKSAEFVY